MDSLKFRSSANVSGFSPLRKVKVVSLATNLPGPVAVSRLQELGAKVTKVEPPSGDPLSMYCRAWYEQLIGGQRVINLDLKDPDMRKQFDELLEDADLLITSMRIAALRRLKLGKIYLSGRFPRLLHVAIVGYGSGSEDIPGHDLTYQASLGLLSPPELPKTLITDLAAAEHIVSSAMALLVARENGEIHNYREVSITAAGDIFAAPLRYKLTAAMGVLGGGFPGYGLYEARDGWVAVAALEPDFQKKLLSELRIGGCCWADLDAILLSRTAEEWEQWARDKDLPIKAVNLRTSCSPIISSVNVQTTA